MKKKKIWIFFGFFLLFLKVLKVRRPGRKTSGFRTVRILKICRTSGPDVMSGRALLQAKLPSLDTYPPPGSPRVTIMSASSVRTLVHCVVKHSRPPDLKSSSDVSLPFA